MLIGWENIKEKFNKNKEFSTEKDLGDFIELNIDKLCETLNIDYKSHSRESYIIPFKSFSMNKPRIDFLIKDKQDRNILIEIKKPSTTYREVNRSIGQLLDYIVIAEENGLNVYKTFLVTTRCDDSFFKIIKRFDLPIELVMISKEFTAIYEKGSVNHGRASEKIST